MSTGVKVTYTVPGMVALLALYIRDRGYVTRPEVADRLGICSRTAERYLAALAVHVFNGRHHPQLRLFGREETPIVTAGRRIWEICHMSIHTAVLCEHSSDPVCRECSSRLEGEKTCRHGNELNVTCPACSEMLVALRVRRGPGRPDGQLNPSDGATCSECGWVLQEQTGVCTTADNPACSRRTGRVEVAREADGRWIAEVLDVPGALAYGTTPGEAIRRARETAQGGQV